MFYTQLESGATPGNRRHLCRVEEGGSIFAISGVRGRSGGRPGGGRGWSGQLLKFARGDLIRLSFEEGLSAQVAVLIDDWLLRAGPCALAARGNSRLSRARVGHLREFRGRHAVRSPTGGWLGAPSQRQLDVSGPGSICRRRCWRPECP